MRIVFRIIFHCWPKSRIEDWGADAQQRDAQERTAEAPARTHVRAAAEAAAESAVESAHYYNATSLNGFTLAIEREKERERERERERK